MSTRSVIARATGEMRFEGRYHHFDGYPEGLGKGLWDAYHGHFQQDLGRMLKFLIDDHPAGWSTILGADLKLKPGYTDYRTEDEGKRRASCYCHGGRHEEAQPIVHDEKSNAADSDLEWAYVFELVDGETPQMHVLMQESDSDKGISPHWVDAGTVLLNEEEPDWLTIECGEDLYRCHHYAYKHFPELHGKPSGELGTQTYLGLRELGFHNAVAFLVNGKRYKRGGWGRSRDIGGSHVWYQGVSPADQELPVAVQKDGKFTPYPGVTWVFPPTKVNPAETFRSGD